MTMTPVCLKIDAARAVEALQEVPDKLDGAGSEMTLDFSSVCRIDPPTLRALEELADAADKKAVTVSLRGVSVDIYKVLKLMKLSNRFSFQS